MLVFAGTLQLLSQRVAYKWAHFNSLPCASVVRSVDLRERQYFIAAVNGCQVTNLILVWTYVSDLEIIFVHWLLIFCTGEFKTIKFCFSFEIYLEKCSPLHEYETIDLDFGQLLMLYDIMSHFNKKITTNFFFRAEFIYFGKIIFSNSSTQTISWIFLFKN